MSNRDGRVADGCGISTCNRVSFGLCTTVFAPERIVRDGSHGRTLTDGAGLLRHADLAAMRRRDN